MEKEKTIREQIDQLLWFHGITEKVEIETEVEDIILTQLKDEKLNRVWVEDGSLVIDFND